MSGELVPERSGLRASHEDRDEIVEQLTVAAGDGRLSSDELDERLEGALAARTYGELAKLVADLPVAAPGSASSNRPALAKDLVKLETRSGSIRRVGPWVVPRRMELAVRSGHVLLDFTQAVVTTPVMEVDVQVRSGHLLLVVPPGVVVDVDGVSVRSGHVQHRVRQAPDEPAVPVRLQVVLTGQVTSGHVLVRGPRRGFWAGLLRRSARRA
ncbi:DUF1707 domain-containing protein [Kitasatospora nipponensis]